MTSVLSWLRRRSEIPASAGMTRAKEARGVDSADSTAAAAHSAGVPADSAGVPAHSTVVPAHPSVIPAEAGIPQTLVFQAAALVLTYPEPDLLESLDTIEAALEGTSAATWFAPVLTHLRHPVAVGSARDHRTGAEIPDRARADRAGVRHDSAAGQDGGSVLSQLQSFHIQEFDLSRRHALHLSYWTDGDTRRRGEVLAEIKGVYRESGLLVDTGGELPDYLPMLLEFAVADPERGLALLQRFRASLELLRLGLTKDGLPHAGVLEAVCRCLPGESPTTHAEVQARYGEARPVEFVGLDLLTRPPREDGELVTSSLGEELT